MQPNKPVVLVVDDDPVNLDILVQTLEQDYFLIIAKNGKRALDLAFSHHPDLILLVICNADEYPLLHTLKMHVDNYDYEAALTVLERIRPSLFSSSAPSTEPSDAAQ